MKLDAAANGLQVFTQNDNGWDQAFDERAVLGFGVYVGFRVLGFRLAKYKIGRIPLLSI